MRMLKLALRTLDLRSVKPPPPTPSPNIASGREQSLVESVAFGGPAAAEEPASFADHIVELKDGGVPLDLANGQGLRGSCHTSKTVRERAKMMATRPATG